MKNHQVFPDPKANFEKRLIVQEKLDREKARRNYVEGIQGRDGGCFPHQRHGLEYLY